MHDTVKNFIRSWYSDNKADIDRAQIADLGSYNVNGGVVDIIPHVVGFDICEGKGVDVVLRPGEIPEEHRNAFDYVVSTSSFTCCPQPEAYKAEIVDLLKPGGQLLLTMCSPKCQFRHSTSPNVYGFQDSFRITPDQTKAFFSTHFAALRCFVADEGEFSDLIYIGLRT